MTTDPHLEAEHAEITRIIKAPWTADQYGGCAEMPDDIVEKCVSTIIARIDRLIARAKGAQDEIERLEKLVYVPGVRRCAKCGFRLITTNLNAATGAMSANEEPQTCPNDGSPMWRVTERDAGNEMIDAADKLQEEVTRLKSLASPAPEGWEDRLARGICNILDLEPDEPIGPQTNFGSMESCVTVFLGEIARALAPPAAIKAEGE